MRGTQTKKENERAENQQFNVLHVNVVGIATGTSCTSEMLAIQSVSCVSVRPHEYSRSIIFVLNLFLTHFTRFSSPISTGILFFSNTPPTLRIHDCTTPHRFPRPSDSTSADIVQLTIPPPPIFLYKWKSTISLLSPFSLSLLVLVFCFPPPPHTRFNHIPSTLIFGRTKETCETSFNFGPFVSLFFFLFSNSVSKKKRRTSCESIKLDQMICTMCVYSVPILLHNVCIIIIF